MVGERPKVYWSVRNGRHIDMIPNLRYAIIIFITIGI